MCGQKCRIYLRKAIPEPQGGAATPAGPEGQGLHPQKIKLWVGTEKQNHEMEISVANGAQILFAFLLPACRIRKHQTWATNQAKSGSSSIFQALTVSSNPGSWGQGEVSGECKGMQRLN